MQKAKEMEKAKTVNKYPTEVRGKIGRLNNGWEGQGGGGVVGEVVWRGGGQDRVGGEQTSYRGKHHSGFMCGTWGMRPMFDLKLKEWEAVGRQGLSAGRRVQDHKKVWVKSFFRGGKVSFEEGKS